MNINYLVNVLIPEKQDVDFLIDFFDFRALPNETFNSFIKRFKFLWKFTIDEGCACGKLFSSFPEDLKNKVLCNFIDGSGKKSLGNNLGLMISKIKNFIKDEDFLIKPVSFKRKINNNYNSNFNNSSKNKNYKMDDKVCFKCGIASHISRFCKTEAGQYDYASL
jgi:hypothetical protein